MDGGKHAPDAGHRYPGSTHDVRYPRAPWVGGRIVVAAQGEDVLADRDDAVNHDQARANIAR